uniref:Uncharacterized protein n=1 Tax=Chromera velia CCMP2878 TaxID=1169474 RepID=A0A0G4I276_9ALVE|eukprot:Cvel_10304.t1-p1 / transcript=Cvel_10304.t1 / gene=Cvel_10304 / organism=Chromera_velia_CCMP2878 / gene_product=Ankyrin-1, putative / transcript_product=Ankyrin-1, putative / location=Cvel_scaffold618:56018-56656(+) / protein_length=213 / sequence_SO=supercontig / SO=protein_coding / is_pseudo=false
MKAYLGQLLHSAVDEGSIQKVRDLANAGANLEAEKDFLSLQRSVDQTPLFRAVWRGNLDIVRFLCDNGARVHCIANNGWDPLFAAAHQGHLDIVAFLLSNSRLSHLRSTSRGQTALYYAARNDHQAVVRALLASCENVTDCLNPNRFGGYNTPLYAAVQGGHLDIVRSLVNADTLADSHRDRGAYDNLINLATRNGNIEIANFLRARGATSVA